MARLVLDEQIKRHGGSRIFEPGWLRQHAWAVVSKGYLSQAAYRRALWAAKRAAHMEPDNGDYLNTYGLAQYRVGAYADALATLTRSDKLNGGIPKDIGLIAMTLHHLGRIDEAKAALDRLRAVIPKDEYLSAEAWKTLDNYSIEESPDAVGVSQDDIEAGPFFEEVSVLLRGAATPDGLNTYAWELLTSEQANLRDPAAALSFAEKAVEESGGKAPGILDTLALAYFLTGDTAKAIQTEEKALSLLPPGDSATRKDLEKSLARFRAAATSQPTTTQPAASQPTFTSPR